MPSPVYSKKRELVNASVTATIGLPAWDPDADPLKFVGDMQGAKIGGTRLEVEDWDSLTTLDVKLQHSDDLSVWTDVDATNLAFTQASGNTTEELDVPDDTFFKRFVRAYCTVAGTGSATVQVYLYFSQCGPRGLLSSPGKVARKA